MPSSTLMFRFSRALLLVALVAVTCCLSSTTALGQVITLVDDKFDDGGFTNGADPLDTEWYGARSVTDGDAGGPYGIQLDDGVPGIGGGNAFFIDRNNTSANGATADLPGATGGAGNVGTGNNGNGLATPSQVWQLVNAGDFIRLEFDYRLLGTIPDSGSALRFGFINRSGTGDTTGFPNGAFDDQSYFVQSGTGTSTALQIRQEFGGGGNLFGGTDRFDGPATVKTNLDNDDTATNAIFTLTKLADGNIQADINLGGDLNSAIFGAAVGSCNANFCFDTTDSFDAFGIFASKEAGLDLIVDNVLVTAQATQVPEPASLALLAMGLAAMTLRRRR